jgi:sterol desaturase/sphingolipid hydroxylase (fatty acid hydroxylase superfamily)
MKSLSSQWATIVSTYPHPVIEFVGGIAIQLLFFWLPCAFYLALESIAPAFSQRHKIQPIPKQPTRADILHCLRVVLQNSAINLAVHATLLTTTHMFSLPQTYSLSPTLPGLFEVVFGVARSVLIREVVFYYVHRIFHLPSIYAGVHKKHHHFIAPVALAAQYATPTEHIFANILPIALPGIIYKGTHILTYWAFLAFQLAETATVHSGYDFFAGAAKLHDSHHELFNMNYGVIGIMDWLHGTNKLPARRKKLE